MENCKATEQEKNDYCNGDCYNCEYDYEYYDPFEDLEFEEEWSEEDEEEL